MSSAVIACLRSPTFFAAWGTLPIPIRICFLFAAAVTLQVLISSSATKHSTLLESASQFRSAFVRELTLARFLLLEIVNDIQLLG